MSQRKGLRSSGGARLGFAANANDAPTSGRASVHVLIHLEAAELLT